MIKKITKLKKLGIFHDFSWKIALPEFNKFNLIYGWNRSGKTTISRVFESCEKGNDRFKQYPENGEFELKTSDGTTVKNTDVSTNTLPIKVFNEDFIDENISFDPSDSCNPIVYVSEEDIESKKQLERIKQHNISLGKAYEEAKKNKLEKENTKNIFLTGLGREIANILFDKSYNKTKVENKISSIGADKFSDKVLSDTDKKKYEAISKSEAGKNQTKLSDYQFSFLFVEKTVDSFQKVYDEVKKLLDKKVVSETLDRLKNDQKLNNWVKQGFDLHKTKNEKEKCLFCQKSLENDFLSMLSKHFSKDYDDLQDDIALLKGKILELKKNTIVLKNDDLYPGLKDNYASKAKELNDCVNKMNAWIDEGIKKLEEKYNNLLVVVANPEVPENFINSYNEIIAELNKIISYHNGKVKNHTNEVLTSREKLELNSIAVALSTQDYKKMGNDIKEMEEKEKEAYEEINKNKLEILRLEKKTSNIGKAIEKINNQLKGFFGREEIKLELDGDKKGYTIKRDGQSAKNLSEGEKTAIAFSYFIVKVGEGDFDKSKGIIFIDDPISSFDSNFIYHCFSLITNHFQDVKQLFISTHNFELFNLVKVWFLEKNRKKKNKGQDNTCELYMIENHPENDRRYATIEPLENTLQRFKSEYHYLFSLLSRFIGVYQPKYDDYYVIGNIARRFLEIFANFKIPRVGDLRGKLKDIIDIINQEGEKISNIDRDKVYKLIQEFSHGFDLTSIIEHKNKNEIMEAIKTLMEIVKESDPKHFELLKDSLK